MTSTTSLILADRFYFVLHTLVILFNLFGWIAPKTRRANLLLLSITAFSWLILGIWKGWGYCFLVEWHWAIREKLGDRDLPASYIKFLLDRATGASWDAALVDWATALAFAGALVASLWVNLKSSRK